MGKRRNDNVFRKHRKNDRVAAGAGPACPCCGKTTARWTWKDPAARANLLGKPAYRFWFTCENDCCRTKTLMPETIALVFPRKAA